MFQAGAGISRLQKGILQALASEERPVAASTILARLSDLPPSPSQRASLSKALKRLVSRGMVVSYHPEIMRPGKGYLYALPK